MLDTLAGTVSSELLNSTRVEPARLLAEGFTFEHPTLSSRLDAAPRRFAELNRRWHERARERHPDWPSVSPEAYLALAGATAELARSMVYAGRTDALPDLEDTLVALNLAVI